MAFDDDLELADVICSKLGLTEPHERRRILDLIKEVRTEALEDAALACENYAENTTFFRKAAAAHECAKRIRELVGS